VGDAGQDKVVVGGGGGVGLGGALGLGWDRAHPASTRQPPKARARCDPFGHVARPQKAAYQLDALEASAQGLPTVHPYTENIAGLQATLDSLYDAHLAVTSGTQGAGAASTVTEVRGCREAALWL
jgi:hypothetical protein